MRTGTLFVTILLASRLGAQDSLRVVADSVRAAPGDAIYLTAPTLGKVRESGTLVSIREDSVRYRVPGPHSTTIAVGFTDISALYVNRGNLPPHGNAMYGAAFGMLGGALAGYVRDVATMTSGECPNICDDNGNPVGGALIGGLAGLLIGAGIGSLIKTESYIKYDQAALPELLFAAAPTWDPGTRAVGVAVALRF